MSARAEEPITGTCSKCHRGATFEWDEDEGKFMSNCCWRYKVPDA